MSAQPPRRMSRFTLVNRAWEYADRNAVPSLSLGACYFWVRLVVAIHEDGDGFRLHLGEYGYRFQARDDLEDLCGRREVLDIDGWLAALVEHGRLIDIEGVDIEIPSGLGLRPGETARGKPMTVRAAKRPTRRFKPVVVQGGRG